MSRVRAYLALAFACAIGLVFASCGGGGGGGTTMNPPPPPPVSPTPTVSPFVCPSPSCTSYTLAGTSTQTVTRFAPLPTPPQLKVVSSVAQSVAVMSGKVFHGLPATDYKTTETDTAPTQAITIHTDNYIQFPASAGNVINIGYASTDSNGVKLDVQYKGANGIIGQVPCCTGWVNSAQSIISETDPDGTTLTETINADGSFTLTKNEVAGTTTETQNSDATGTATIPVVGFFGAGVGTGTRIDIPAQSGGMINLTFSAVGAPAPTPPPIVLPVGAWYAPGQTLATDATHVVGVTSIPAGCVAPPFGPSGLQLQQLETRYDVVFGIQDAETTDTWVTAAVGPVCQRISDTVNIYYDWTGQSGGVLLGGPSAIQTNVMNELIGMQAAARADSARTLGTRSATSSFEARVIAARARVDRWRLSIRNNQLRNLQNLLKRGLGK